MSDPGWCGKHNYRSQTTDAVCPHCKRERESADEIERLRAGWNDCAEEFEKAQIQVGEINADRVIAERRIEELESSNAFLKRCARTAVFISEEGELKNYICGDCHSDNWTEGHHITTAKIRAAVEYANDLNDHDLSRFHDAVIWRVLLAFGFERCGKCNGYGVLDPDPFDDESNENGETCPACHGIGAVRIEEEADDSNTNTR